ncbi:methylenetetrahydrofolate dehydrogenase (NADP+)/methenyltetrahydrofolate cyclohydrolase [Balneicella halophila]|uniref:Bifunctional protein FolD n=1 Tax=Balneicella halophila TaxID=1537566 RepID=A0A7L4UNQ8_BALHA|nr:tetrahydrofolate dehydrogenase/cyclohydrolase catalytic domain-containing protein [Balneicella halophila]PVX49968.1 methylenetetrahydrofolate dehydrogenase (NADP+)/methenyltetrahydrofolate cyclohydrolase [Balneicella halophila]
MQLIDGKKTSKEIREEIAEEVKEMTASEKRTPKLVAVLVGNDGASRTYVNAKSKACEKVGFGTETLHFEESMTQDELLKEVEKLNNDDEVDGFIVQVPLPKHIDEDVILQAINPKKDVDGFHPTNIGRMTLGLPTYLPATPAGIVELLKRYNIETSGKNCVVIGRSNIVGTPVSILLSRKTEGGNSTVTLCHSRTADIKAHTLQADIIIVAIGKKHFLTEDMVKDGAVIVDVGIHREEKENGVKLYGDVDFENVAPKCSYITPVPGGVGPMTIVSLLQNTLLAAKGEIYKK